MDAGAEVVKGVSAHTFSEGACPDSLSLSDPWGAGLNEWPRFTPPKSKAEKHRVRF